MPSFSGAALNEAITNATLFAHDTERNIYRLNPSVLPAHECHMFFPVVGGSKELLIVTLLEFNTFHPADKKMNDKFNVKVVKCGDVDLFWCSFPKGFKEVCGRAAKVAGMTMKTESRQMTLLREGIRQILQMPQHENLLVFQGERNDKPGLISKECEDIKRVCDSLEKLGVD